MASERRLATILFADISGFTSMSEKMDAELVTRAMNECFGMLGAIVERNGGTIDKFIGDCIMVLFGVPQAVEDSPRRAVQTALEMREAIHEARSVGGVEAELDIHVGVNTGEVISGDIGSEQKKEFTVIGDAVNLASRLKDAAPRGQIYVGLQTYLQTKDKYEYNRLEPIVLKGKENPTPVHELRFRKSGVASGRMIFSPLVGRQRELDMLELQVLKVINGEGSIVQMIGEAGLGKSRLIAELKNKECMKRVTLLEGRAQSFGKNLSFHPIIDLLKGWAAIREEDGEAEAFRRLEIALRSVSPGEADEALPFIATLMAMKLSGKLAQRIEGIAGDALAKLIFKNARDVLSRGAQRRPLVIVLEDMHWADESTVEFVEYLFKMVENDRVLFLNVSRPIEERSDRLTRTAREGFGGRCVELVLHPLGAEGCAELIRNLLKSSSVPSSITASIVNRTGGNPFFIEEVMRAAIDQQSVEVGKEGFRPTEKLGSFVVPSTVNEVIMSRFDRLDKETRELLRVASVIGRTFYYSVLVHIVQGVGSIEKKIDGLKEMQIILERRRMEEVEYQFTHALVQEAIYDSILLQVRKELHLSVARTMESIFSERLGEFAGMLALHYTRGEDYDKAEEHMIKAGAEALRSAASSEALNYYREALDLYLKKQGENADPAKVEMLEKNIARSLFYRGRIVEALPYYDRLPLSSGIIKIPAGKFKSLFAFAKGIISLLAYAYLPQRTSVEAPPAGFRDEIDLLTAKLGILTLLDAVRCFREATTLVPVLVRFRHSDFEQASLFGLSLFFSIGGISLALSHKIIEKTARLLSQHSTFAQEMYEVCLTAHDTLAGRWAGCRSLETSVVERLLARGNFQYAIVPLVYDASAQIERGERRTFTNLLNKIFDIANVYDNEIARGHHAMELSRSLVKYREYSKLRGLLPEFRKVMESGDVHTNTHLWADTGRLELFNGNDEEAERDIEKALAMNKKVGGLVLAAGAAFGAAAALWVERMRKAASPEKVNGALRHEAKRAVARYLSNSRKCAPDLTEALRFAGHYWWYRGNHSKAVMFWKQALREGARLGARLEIAHTYTDAGVLLGDQPRGADWRQRGVNLYAELGLAGNPSSSS